MPAAAHAPRTYTIRKPSGGTRLMAQLEPPDALRWDRIGRAALPAIERALGPEVLAGRGATEPALGPALARARREARRLAAGTEATLRTDVASFYPSIRPEVLAVSLRAAGVDREIEREAVELVEGWQAHGVAGLPVGPSPSAPLANLVLAPVDSVLRALHVPFLRWVDDYLIAVDEDRTAPVLDAIDGELETLGLARHTRKTRLEPAGNTSWLGTLSHS